MSGLHPRAAAPPRPRKQTTVAKNDHPLLQRTAAIQYWDLLHDTIAACQVEGTPEAEVLRRAAVTWATVYGISRLSAFGQLPASVSASADELIHDAINQLIAGWQQPGATLPLRRRTTSVSLGIHLVGSLVGGAAVQSPTSPTGRFGGKTHGQLISVRAAYMWCPDGSVLR